MTNENNKMQVDIENLFKQNVNDFSAIKELYRKLKEVEEKISQIKYIDSTLANKLKKEYEKFKKIILDENVQAKLANDINTINSQLDTKMSKKEAKNIFETINSQLDTIANKGTTVEVLERVTKEEIDRQVADGTIANLTIEDNSIDAKKLNFSKYNSLGYSIVNIDDFDTIGKLDAKGVIFEENTSYKTTSKFIEVMEGQYIESNSRSGARGLVQVCFYSSADDSSYMGTVQNDVKTGIFTVPSGCKYVRFSSNITNLDYYPNIKIQKGDFIQPIELDRPYKINAITENEIYYNEITVKQNGSGDFTTPQEAVAWIKDSSFNNRYNILIYEGEYDVYSNLSSEQLERGIILPDYTYLIGVGKKDNIILRGQQNAGEDDTNVKMRSPLNINMNNGLKNLTVIAKNSRYAVHADNSNFYKDYEWNIENCSFIHEGNDSSFTWQTCIAWGSGSASGGKEYFKNCIFKGKVGYTSHNNRNFENDTYQEFENCKFIADTRINSVEFISMNSGVEHNVVFKGCQFTGYIKCSLNGATDVEYTISGYNNSKVAHSFPNGSNKFINFSDEINTSIVAAKDITKGVPVRDYGYQIEPQWANGTKDSFYGGIALNNATIGQVCYFKHSGFIDLTNIISTTNGDYVGIVKGKLSVVSSKSDAIGQVIQGDNFMKLF